MNIDTFDTDTIDEMASNLKRGNVDLVKPMADAKLSDLDMMSLLLGVEKVAGERKLEVLIEEVKEDHVPIFQN